MAPGRSGPGLGGLGDPRALDRSLPLLKDPKGRVRKEAAWALGSIADERAVPVADRSPE